MLVDLALELGIVHFDTAPAYGDTLAEAALGEALASARDGVVLATKYGIPANPIVAAMPFAAVPIKGLRVAARKLGLTASPHPPMTAAGLRHSVEASLSRLRTDRIDILFLHEPDPVSVPDPEGMLAELVALRERGKVRHFGLAGDWRGIEALGQVRRSLGMVLQTNERQWPESEPPDITYGAIAAGPQTYGAPAIAGNMALDRLQVALERRKSGVVIVSTTSAEHLRQLAMIGGVA